MRSLTIGILILFLSGCTAMLVGADIQPAAQQDKSEDEDESKRKK